MIQSTLLMLIFKSMDISFTVIDRPFKITLLIFFVIFCTMDVCELDMRFVPYKNIKSYICYEYLNIWRPFFKNCLLNCLQISTLQQPCKFIPFSTKNLMIIGCSTLRWILLFRIRFAHFCNEKDKEY